MSKLDQLRPHVIKTGLVGEREDEESPCSSLTTHLAIKLKILASNWQMSKDLLAT